MDNFAGIFLTQGTRNRFRNRENPYQWGLLRNCLDMRYIYWITVYFIKSWEAGLVRTRTKASLLHSIVVLSIHSKAF